VKRPFVKVCGLTRAEDVRAAVALGADAVGFILHAASPRGIDLDTAARLVAEAPPGVARVAVTVNAVPDAVAEAAERLGLDAVQAHGEESPETCAEYGIPVVKALRTAPGFTEADVAPYAAFAILLDGFRAGLRGGTGARADWTLAVRLARGGYRVILAGGLSADNLASAMEEVEPLAVDLNSGVESAPGIKDHERLRAAFAAIAPGEPRPREERPW